MRWLEITEIDEVHCELDDNPFGSSVIQQELYHGSSSSNIEHFNRSDKGIWFSEYGSWSDRHYSNSGSGQVYICYVDVHNPYHPTDEENDKYYGRMDLISEFFRELADKGYDAYIQGGESGTIAVFQDVDIINKITGEYM